MPRFGGIGHLAARRICRPDGRGGGSTFFCRGEGFRRYHSLDPAHVPLTIPLPLRAGSVFERALRTREALFIPDIELEPGIEGSGWDGYRDSSLLVFPLIDQREAVAGLVSLHSKQRAVFSEQDRELGRIVASFASETLRALEAAETLRDRESHLARLMANLPGMAYRCDCDKLWTMRFVSQGCKGLTGHAPEDLVNNRVVSFLSLIHEDDRTRIREQVRAALEARQPYRFTYRIRAADGARKWVWEQGAAVYSESGELRGLEGFVTDITERMQAEAERTRLAMAVEQSAESIVITDALGIIEYVNPAFELHTGYSRNEALGRDFVFLRSDKHDASFHAELWDTIASGQVWRGRIVGRKKDGSLCEEETAISPVRDAAGAIINFVSASTDVTKEVQLQQHLRQAQKMEAIGELAAGVAHEINTPTQYIGDNIRFFQESFEDLRSLLEANQALCEAAAGIDALRPMAEHVAQVSETIDLPYLLEELPTAIRQSLEGNRRVAEIVRAMKEFAHPGTDEMTGIDLTRSIQSTISVARNEWRYVAEVKTELDPELPFIPGHASSFNQVLLNILVNAAHAIAEKVGENPMQKGLITVSTRRVDGWAEVRIADTGAGGPNKPRPLKGSV